MPLYVCIMYACVLALCVHVCACLLCKCACCLPLRVRVYAHCVFVHMRTRICMHIYVRTRICMHIYVRGQCYPALESPRNNVSYHHHQLYAFDWLMTLFARLHLPLGLRVLDAFLYLGWDIVIRVSERQLRTIIISVSSTV